MMPICIAFSGDFTPVLTKHSKSFSLIDCISVGIDRMQRNFEPMRKQVEAWQRGARPKRLRFLIFHTPGKLIHHARRTLLRLQRSWNRFGNWQQAMRLLPWHGNNLVRRAGEGRSVGNSQRHRLRDGSTPIVGP